MDNPITETAEGVVFEGRVFQNRTFELEEFDANSSFDERRAKYTDGRGFPIRINEGGILYLPDKWKSREHFEGMNEDDAYRKRLERMKGLLTDESLPNHLVFRVIEDEYTIYGVEDFGRHWLVWLVGEVGFQQALPELREVMLHDSSYEMREQAIESISRLKGKKVASALCDKLRDTTEKMALRQLSANKLYDHPSADSVSPLRNTYEETAYTPPERDFFGPEFAIHQGRWMPNYCLRALGKIATLDALDGIETGLDHPMKAVQHWSRVALEDWVRTNAEAISNEGYKGNLQERVTLLKKLILKYGCDSQKDFYDNVRI